VDPRRARERVHRVRAGLGALMLGAMAVPALPACGPTGLGQSRQGAATARLGEACRSIHRYPAALDTDSAGHPTATFSFAGGAAHGSLPLSPTDAARLHTEVAYVWDAQLGSYEAADLRDPRSRLVCRLNPTFHFYCPPTDALDELCLTWADVTDGSGR